jgi:hypothetical protein
LLTVVALLSINFNLLFYRYLRKVGKLSQAELMYSVAFSLMKNTEADLVPSDGVDEDGNELVDGGKQERRKDLVAKYKPMAFCNYATFLFERHRRAYANEPTDSPSFREAEDGVRRAREMFVEGLEQFPKHRGLQKNFKLFAKSIQQLTDQLAHSASDKGEEALGPAKKAFDTPAKASDDVREDVTEAMLESPEPSLEIVEKDSGRTRSADAQAVSSSSRSKARAAEAKLPKAEPSGTKLTSKGKTSAGESKSTVVGTTRVNAKTSSKDSRAAGAKDVHPSPRMGKAATATKGKSAAAGQQDGAKAKISPRLDKKGAAAAIFPASPDHVATVPADDDYVADYGAESNHNDLVGLWSNFGGFDENA